MGGTLARVVVAWRDGVGQYHSSSLLSSTLMSGTGVARRRAFFEERRVEREGDDGSECGQAQ
jgi:hypothetical protein